MEASRNVPEQLTRGGSGTWYLRAWRQQLEPAQARLLRRARVRGGERVLDVACGTGLVTFAAAAAAGRAGEAVGTDFSQVNVDLARARARASGLSNVRFARMDAERLDLSDASFDVALCALGLAHVPSPARALREMARVVVPGGRVAVAVWGSSAQCGWSRIFSIVNAHAKPAVCPEFYALGTGDNLPALFRDAGLTDVVSERLETRLEWMSSDDALGATVAGGPIAPVYSRFDECTRRAVDGAYMESLQPWRIGDAYSVPGEFVIVIGRKNEA